MTNWNRFGALRSWMVLALMVVCGLSAPRALAVTQVFAQPPNAAGGQFKSAWYAPNGLDGDEYVWDNFTIPAGAAITEVRWRGAYTNYLQGAGRAPVYDFTIEIYRSTPGLVQPDLQPGGRLAQYHVGGNAGETAVGSAGGVIMYDYAFTLPAPFQAAPGTMYWVQIEAWQGVTPQYYWPPDWSIARGTGGNNQHFRFVEGGQYFNITGDAVFSLYTADAPTVSIQASASPANAGAVTGAGSYPINTTATLDANANAGWAFVRWTENGGTVSTNAHYAFNATVNRTLVANFSPAHSLITSSYPLYAGTTSGGGVYADGASVTVTATANPGFVFSGWSDGSTDAVHTFPLAYDLQLTAFFDSAPLSETFDFDAGPSHTSLPLQWTVDGLGAAFSATGGGFSVQPVGSVGLAPAGFSGLMLFPNSVFGGDLIVDFSEPLVDFSILYSPQEIGCDDSATMRVTVSLDDAFVATNTATVPNPGTYPTGRLAIATTTPFNRAIVHYDSRPPRCQDYGIIFLADIVTVTRACQPPAIATNPLPQSVCPSGTASFGASGTGAGQLAFRWQRQLAPADWADLADGDLPGIGFIFGATSDILSVSGAQTGAAGFYRCVISNPCGEAISDGAELIVCPADFDCSGGVDGDDVILFFALWDANDIAADFNNDGGVDGDDVIGFFGRWDAGC